MTKIKNWTLKHFDDFILEAKKSNLGTPIGLHYERVFRLMYEQFQLEILNLQGQVEDLQKQIDRITQTN